MVFVIQAFKTLFSESAKAWGVQLTSFSQVKLGELAFSFAEERPHQLSTMTLLKSVNSLHIHFIENLSPF